MPGEDYNMMRPVDNGGESPMTNDPGPQQPPQGMPDNLHTMETEVPITGKFCEDAAADVKRESYPRPASGTDPAVRY